MQPLKPLQRKEPTIAYLEQRRHGGKLIERLSAASLSAAASATGRTVAELMNAAGYQER